MSKTGRFLQTAEYTSLIAAGVGVVVAEVSRQTLFASAPLGLALFLSMVNRKRDDQVNEQNFTSDLWQMRQNLLSLDQGISQNIEGLRQQFLSMPSVPEFSDLSQVEAQLMEARQEVEQRLRQELTELDLALRENVNALQEQWAELPAPPAVEVQALETQLDSSLSAVRSEMAQQLEVVEAMRSEMQEMRSQLEQRVEPIEPVQLQPIQAGLQQLQAELLQLRNDLQANPSQPTDSPSQTLQAEISALRSEVQQLRQVPSPTLKQELAPLVTLVKYLYQRQTTVEKEVVSAVQQEVQKGLSGLKPQEPHPVPRETSQYQTHLDQFRYHLESYPFVELKYRNGNGNGNGSRNGKKPNNSPHRGHHN